jgi:hypothetical protein
MALAKNKAIVQNLKQLGRALAARPPSIYRTKQLIFLCGANRAENTPSYRRESIKKFIESVSDDFRVIYAEAVFNELTKIGHNKNALDMEHDISSLADRIIIVLESQSAFCELGAFAHQALREKIIVINDENFRTSPSFINTGPIAALWYKMSPEVRSSVDGIGIVFSELERSLRLKSKLISPEKKDVWDLRPDKISLYFIHDLVHLSGPVTYKELIFVLETMFGKKRYDPLSGLLGVLRAVGLILSEKFNDDWIFRTTGNTLFLKSPANSDQLMVRFRLHHLKNYPERFKLGAPDRKNVTRLDVAKQPPPRSVDRGIVSL